MMPSFDVVGLVSDTLTQRLRGFSSPYEAHWLAARIVATTVYNGVTATPCPTCFSVTRGTQLVENDPRCYGVGYIIPASGGQSEVGGYLPPAPFDCLIVPGSTREEQTADGITAYGADTTAQWIRQNIMAPKKGDVLIAAVAGQARTERFILADVVSVSDLGSVTIEYKAALESRDEASIVYRVAIPDTSGPIPGTWS